MPGPEDLVSFAYDIRVVGECRRKELPRMRQWVKRMYKTAAERSENGTLIVVIWDADGHEVGRNVIVPDGFEPPSEEAQKLVDDDEDHPHVA